MAIDHVMGWPKVLATAKRFGVVDDSMNDDAKVEAICAMLENVGIEALADDGNNATPET